MCSPPSPTRSRTRGHRTATAPMPVTISRSGRCPWRTSRRRPSSVNLSVWVLSQAATSASTACPNSVLAPLRKTSVSGSENVPGWVSSKTLVSVTAYHSFGGEVEALNTPTIRRLTPSCRHQLSALAPATYLDELCGDLIESVHKEGDTSIVLKTDIASELLPTDQAIPIGLIVNELVTNAVKYGFPGDTKGTVLVTLKRVPGELRLTVADDGQGVDPRRADSGVGGRPVDGLPRQLRGQGR